MTHPHCHRRRFRRENGRPKIVPYKKMGVKISVSAPPTRARWRRRQTSRVGLRNSVALAELMDPTRAEKFPVFTA
jgi:hypothetical protein